MANRTEGPFYFVVYETTDDSNARPMVNTLQRALRGTHVLDNAWRVQYPGGMEELSAALQGGVPNSDGVRFIIFDITCGDKRTHLIVNPLEGSPNAR